MSCIYISIVRRRCERNIHRYHFNHSSWDGDETDTEVGKTLSASQQWVSETKQELLTDGGIEVTVQNTTTCILDTEGTRVRTWEYVTDHPDSRIDNHHGRDVFPSGSLTQGQ